LIDGALFPCASVSSDGNRSNSCADEGEFHLS
jgi:hypothetical protein